MQILADRHKENNLIRGHKVPLSKHLSEQGTWGIDAVSHLGGQTAGGTGSA